ncbi:MAG: ATP-binding protein, partial [Clostridiales bacterium]|nr:ATP-binding protein [Clostridiales bacterium]
KLWLRAEGELAALQSVLARQYEQYCRQKESIETVNRKYHDIKYQIAVIRAEGDPQKRQAHLDAMESSIRFHEAQSKVGNTVLDTILSAKNMECFDKNISFSVVADGGLLDFIDVMDICSVFGNALDNAIESVATLREREKRIIKLAVYSKTGFLIIKVDNYCEAKLKYENGAISTTKTNPSDHGYGLKSIRLTAEKYGGTVTVNASDNWFGLCIVIPMPEGKS